MAQGGIAFDLLRLIEARDAERDEARRRGDLASATEIEQRAIDVEVRFEGDVAPLVEAGFDLRPILPGFARAALTIDEIRSLAERTEVAQLRLPVRLEPILADSTAQMQVPAARTHLAAKFPAKDVANGIGVTIGVIDSGVRAALPALRNGNDSAIHRLWDQTFRFNAQGQPADGGGTALTGARLPTDENGAAASPARTPKATLGVAALDYGIDFTAAQIKTALAAGRQPLSLEDTPDLHGTKIACIIANRASASEPSGIAPAARLIVVKVNPSNTNLDHAIQYIVAASKAADPAAPVVINISLANHSEPHSGRGTTAQTLDKHMTDNPKLAIVVGAGNERADNIHATLEVPRGTKATLPLFIHTHFHGLELFVSYNDGSAIDFRVTREGTTDSGPVDVKLGTGQRINFGLLGQQHLLGVSPEPVVSTDPDRHFKVFLEKEQGLTIDRGPWQLEFEVKSSSTVEKAFIHVWRSHPYPDTQATQFLPDLFDPKSPQDGVRWEWMGLTLGPFFRRQRPEDWIRCTVSSVATAKRPIVVAACDALPVIPEIASFSSQGPALTDLSTGLYTRTYAKPDIAAPGVKIEVAGSPSDGTSFASPHAAGLVALMWSANPSLTNEQVKSRLLGTAHPPQDARLPAWSIANPRIAEELFGKGTIDALDAVKKALEP